MLNAFQRRSKIKIKSIKIRTITAHYFQQTYNSTDDLEVRVTLLENDVSVLQDEVEELESDNTQQDDRFLIIEGNVAGNSDDIDGKLLSHLRPIDTKQKWKRKGRKIIFVVCCLFFGLFGYSLTFQFCCLFRLVWICPYTEKMLYFNPCSLSWDSSDNWYLKPTNIFCWL